jgi:hypothetical protein
MVVPLAMVAAAAGPKPRRMPMPGTRRHTIASRMGPLPAVLLAVLGGCLVAQAHDARDVVRTKKGDEVRGRVSRYYAPDAIVVMQGSLRVRVPRSEVVSVETVNDRLRDFFQRLDTGGDNPKYRWMLAQWAASQGLDRMARALALQLVLDDDGHQQAHELLGHVASPRGWRWPLGDRGVDRKLWLEHHADMGHPLAVVGEHFAVETDADPRSAVYALLDLERMYLHWMDTFGVPLQLREALLPMRMRIWSSREKMPGLASHKRPYFAAMCINVDEGVTCLVSPTLHEVDRLFELATQMAVGGTLAGLEADGAEMAGIFDCPWAVLGLAQWMQASFEGAPGRAKPREPQLLRDAIVRLQANRPNLRRLLPLKYAQFFDLTSRTQERWDASWAAVHFLLDRKQKPDLSARFQAYLLASIRQGVGGSSSEFDKSMKVSLEAVEKALSAWLDTL